MDMYEYGHSWRTGTSCEVSIGYNMDKETPSLYMLGNNSVLEKIPRQSQESNLESLGQ